MSTVEYGDFLAAKVDFDTRCGYAVERDEIHPILKPHQRDIVQWAVRGGRRAIFAAFGMGKSVMQIETLRLTLEKGGGTRALIVCPLGVRQEFAHDAAMLGQSVTFVRWSADVGGPGIYITNYESVRDGRLDPSLFDAVSLDEASVLRSYGSKTYQEFLTLFDQVPHRFVATATPSPNRFKELIHYAGFLGVMDTGQALTRFFQRDSTKANNLTLYPHKEREFWLWLHSWSIFLQSPADLGYDATGYDLPPLVTHWHEVDPSDDDSDPEMERDGQARLIRGVSIGLKEAAAEKRRTLAARLEKMKELIDGIRSEGIPPRVLPPESGTSVGPATREGRQEVTGGEGSVPAGLLGGEPDGVAGEAARAWAEELRGEPRGIRPKGSPGEAEDVRPDGAGLPEHARQSGRPMCDLPHDARSPQLHGSPTVRGSRPLNGESSGAAVPAVQLGVGHVRGRRRPAASGNRLPQQLIIWCHLNDEQRAIEKALDEMGITHSSIYGSLDTEEVEARLADWKARETDVLIGKPVMLGQGMNLQQCSTAIYLGLDWSFNSLIQSVHRIQRYGQTRTCHVHLIHAEAEREVVAALREKWTQHEELTHTMTAVIREHGLSHAAISEALTRSMGVERIEASGDGWLVANNDCVPETAGMETDSVDLIVTSIPFSNHYEYTPSYNDFGHTDDNGHFWSQMDFLTPELLRVLRPGRIYACHVKDRILFGNVTGAGVPTVSPFHAEAIFHAQRHGFDYLGMITVVTDVVRENNQTYRLGWSEMAKDGTKMGVGSPEYVLLFHKPQTDRSKGYADVPVTKDKAAYTRARWQVDAHAFWRSAGDRLLTPDELAALPVDQRSRLFTEQTLRAVYDYESHIKIGEQLDGRGALPATFMSLAPGSWHPEVWHDVNRMLTLNGEQSRKAQAFHVCPLQFDIVDRLIRRYSNEGELVYDPFGGLFTVPLRALKLGRRGRAAELNPGYFLDGVKYLEAQDREAAMPSLFDLDDDLAS